MKTKLLMTFGWMLYHAIALLITSSVGAASPTELASQATFCTATQTKPWEWSPPAKHHSAVVSIVANKKAGTGVYFATDQIAGILTAQHVVSGGGPYKVIWPDGQVDSATVRKSDKHGNDLAILLLPKLRRDVKPLPITQRDTYQGEKLEMVGYGGPGAKEGENTMRHFWITQTAKKKVETKQATPGAMKGDSGGPIFSMQNGEPHIVSVCNAGSTATRKDQRMPGGVATWFDDVIYPSPNRTVGFVAALQEDLLSDKTNAVRRRVVSQPKVCPPTGCPPRPTPIAQKKQIDDVAGRRPIVNRVCPPGGCPPKQGNRPDSGGDYELYPPEGFGLNDQRPDQIQANADSGADVVGPLIVILAIIAAVGIGFHKRVVG